jgi:hypothetical protein
MILRTLKIWICHFNFFNICLMSAFCTSRLQAFSRSDGLQRLWRIIIIWDGQLFQACPLDLESLRLLAVLFWDHLRGRWQAEVVLIQHLENESQLLVLGLLLETNLSAETYEEADLGEGVSDPALVLDAGQLPLFLDKILMQVAVSPQL